MRFRRKAGADSDEATTDETGLAEASDAAEPDATESGPSGAAGGGPFDAEELAEDGVERIDLGSLLVRPVADRELRLQVDEASGRVQSVMLAGPDGVCELRAFAAARGGDLWSEVRPQIAADMARRGGTATEREGPFGTELHCRVTVRRDGGGTGTQVSRVIGVNGPRWMLRATLLGRPASEPESAADWERLITEVAVRRGTQAMAPGEPLPLALPEGARRVPPASA